MTRPSPFALWTQSCDEHGQGTDAQRSRYRELMIEHGHIVKAKPGADRNLPCGWPGLPAAPDDLLTAPERERLNDDLADMARARRRAEAEAGQEPMA
jgi:hypothetical protein